MSEMPASPESERDLLRKRAEVLRAELARVERRLSEVEGTGEDAGTK
jgi:hypothetical protein